MKTLNLVRTAVVILVLSILVGCSDQITSSGDDVQTYGKRIYPKDTDYGIPAKNVFRTEIRLKPHRSYKFNKSNMPFVKITSFDIVNIAVQGEDKFVPNCQDIKVYSNLPKYDGALGCSNKGLNLSELTIENTSSQFISLSVELDGVRAKKFVDVVNE